MPAARRPQAIVAQAILGTLSARVAARIVDFCQTRGHDVEALCRRAGFSLASLAGPEARIPYEVVARLGEGALAVLGDENFGLHLAADVRDSRHFDPGVLLLMSSPTVRVALERMAAHQRYWGDGQRVVLRRVRGGMVIRYRLAGAVGAYARHANECAMAEIALGVRQLSGPRQFPREVRFGHPRPRRTDEHQAVFGCPMVFGAPETELVYDDAVLDERMAQANDAFADIFTRQVENALARLPRASSVSDGVVLVARTALAAGGCTLAGTARALGLSPRTLQRRLRAEGASFGALAEALRRELSVAYLTRGLPIAEIASLLGYAETTAFHHAFRRWTGTSPSRYLTDDAPSAVRAGASQPAATVRPRQVSGS